MRMYCALSRASSQNSRESVCVLPTDVVGDVKLVAHFGVLHGYRHNARDVQTNNAAYRIPNNNWKTL